MYDAYLISSEAGDTVRKETGENTVRINEIISWFTFVHTLIHEELHAVTDNGHQISEEFAEEEEILSVTHKLTGKIGFNKIILESKNTQNWSTGNKTEELKQTKQATGINEAVTELISLRIARQYLKQSPRNSFEQKYVDEILLETQSGYQNEMRVTEQYIALISALTDVPEDIILNGLFAEYIHNKAYLPDEFAQLLVDSIPKLPDSDSQWLTQLLRTQLSANNFQDSQNFNEVLLDIIGLLPEDIQEKIRIKLHKINIKYFGDL